MLPFYFELQDKYSKKYGDKTIVLMQCGGFYESYSTDDRGFNLRELAVILNIQYTKRNKSLPVSINNPYMLGFPVHSLKKFKRVLTENGFTVVVYYQVDTLRKVERKLLGIYTYGTNLEESENIFDTNSEDITCIENNIVCLYIDEDMLIHASRIDLTTGKGSVLINPYTDLYLQIALIQRFLQVYPSREIVYNQDIFDNFDLDENKIMLQKINISLQNKINYQIELLERVYGKSDILTPIEKIGLEKYPDLVTSWTILIDYAYERNPKIIRNLMLPDFFEEHNHLTLENNAIEQLNIVSNNSLEVNAFSKKFLSVYHVVNNCTTNMGKRYLKMQLLRPLSNIQQINDRYNASTFLSDSWETIEDKLLGIVDIEKLQRRLSLSIINSLELTNLYQSYKIIESLIGSQKWDTPFLKCIPQIENCIKELERIFSFETFEQEIIFNKGIYQEIDNLTETINADKNKIFLLLDYLNKLINVDEKKEVNGVKLEYTEKDGYFFTVSLKRSFAIKHQIEILKDKPTNFNLENLIFKQLPKSPSVKIFYTDTSFTDVRENTSIMKTVVKQYWNTTCLKFAEEFKETFNSIVEWICRLDFIKSNLKTSKINRYSRPQIKKNKKSYVKIKELRHPIIEKIIKDKEPYVAHNLSLGTGKQDGILLYGLNSSGKSSMMKAIGISVILAQAGLYVPATEFTYSPYSTIFTRITGNDNIFKGLSSFTLEMLEINNILKRANENCLIISDEVCRSTESISACSIVSSMLIILSKRKCSFIFTSHLHDICQINEIKNLDNLKVYNLKIDVSEDGKITYHRELTAGQGDTIYGLKVAKALINNQEFLMIADKMRDIHTLLYHQGHKNGDEIRLKIVEEKQSKYNSAKFMTSCEICGKKRSYKGELETHHIIPQELCDEDGFLKEKPYLHMNSKWNLENLCNQCHIDHHNLEKNRNSTIVKWKQKMSSKEISEKLQLFSIKLSTGTINKIV